MSLSALALALVLSQDPPPAEPAAVPAPAAAVPAPDAPAAVAPVAPRPKGVDDVQKLLKRLPEMSLEDRTKAIAQIQKQYGSAEANPVLPPVDMDLEKYAELPAVDQARVSARHFFTDLINADPTAILAHCGFPFMLEDRRVDRPDELRADWVKSLHSKRTDLLKLYDLEVLTPQEMVKKFGAPPRRLSSWGFRAPNTFVGVANLSGHAAVVVLKQVGAAWQVVAYHD